MAHAENNRILEVIEVAFKIIILSIVVTTLRIYRFIRKRSSYDVRCLRGKTAIITGGNSGIGYSAALLLASRGCKIIIADCINAEKSVGEIKEITGNPDIYYKHLDLSSLKNVRKFAIDIRKTEGKIDILVNNAGISDSESITTEEGLNYIMQVNFFGSFLLTHLLLDLLKNAKSSHVIFTSSVTMFIHKLSKIDDLNPTQYEHNESAIIRVYSNSKMSNTIAAFLFSKKLRKYGVMVNSYDPWGVRTAIFDKAFSNISIFSIYNIVKEIGLFLMAQTPIEAAKNILHLVANEEVCNTTGGHYVFCQRMLRPSIVFDQSFTDQFWKKCEELVNLSPEERLGN